MASSSRARAALIASGILIATPAGAQSTDTPAPPPAGQSKPAGEPAKAPPPPPPRPMSMQPSAMTQKPQAPAPGPRRHKGHAPPRRKRGEKVAVEAGAPIAGPVSFFRLDDGSTRVSVEVTRKVDVAEGHAEGRLLFRMRGAFIPLRTNRLPLLTGYFPTPVDRAQLVQDGPDVELVIELREATAPTHRVVETPRGIVLQVDFPRVAAADHAFDAPPDNAGRERAKRRTKTQSLGTDHNEEPPNRE